MTSTHFSIKMRFSGTRDQDPFGYQQVIKIRKFSIKEPASSVEKITFLGSHLKVGNGALLRTKLQKQPSIISKTYLHHPTYLILMGFWTQWITWLLHKWLVFYSNGIIQRRPSKPCFKCTHQRHPDPMVCNNYNPFNLKFWSYVAKDELYSYCIDPKK